MTDYLLRAVEVRKYFAGVKALDGVTLEIRPGEVHCLAGENGCGKSMLMRVICGLVLPTSGRIMIDGEELGKELSFPESIGVFIEKPGFLDAYSGFQNLSMLASIKKKIGDREIKQTLKRVGLEDVMHKKYKKYSLGMKQKLGIAAVIMEQPDIVILDEPANALDEKSEQRLWQIVKEEKERGALVIISCHTSEVLEEISDEIFKMDQGQITEHIVCR